MENIKSILVGTPDGQRIPMSDLATIGVKTGAPKRRSRWPS